jgi:hypothetical protein
MGLGDIWGSVPGQQSIVDHMVMAITDYYPYCVIESSYWASVLKGIGKDSTDAPKCVAVV